MGTMPTPELYVTAKGQERWRVRFRLDHKFSSKTFDDQRGALAFASLIAKVGPAQALHILAERLGATEGTVTVADWCRQHVAALSGVQPDTLARYRAYITNDLGALADLPLTAVTHETVSAWVNELEARGQQGKTIKNKHGFLSSAFSRAVRRGLVPSNPCEGTGLPRSVRQEMVFLGHDEYARFIGYFTPCWQPLVAVLFSTGLRWGEATALRVGDVNLDQATITVTRAWKAGRVLGPPKSERSRRTISIAPETVDVLRPLTEDRPASAWVFTNARGGPVRLQTFHDNVWQPAVRLANGEPGQSPTKGAKRVARRRDASGHVIEPATEPLGKRPRPHDARHSCASWLLGAGVPINYVQAHLGHESITTTVDRYGHVMPAARQAIAGALSLALTAAHPQIEPIRASSG